MQDPVVGGYTEKKRKLRRAISIAFNVEEQISIFAKGRAIPAQSPIPPWIFGHEEGEAGMNPRVYRWDANGKRPVRRSLAEAKMLLAEVGYPNGYGADGKTLAIRFATIRGGADEIAGHFVRRQVKKLGIRLDVRTNDYKDFQDKVRSGSFQCLQWGWVADYPDPENFLFLLYGPNGKRKHGGVNLSNYANAEFDRLFEQMQSMDNTPERLAVILRMTRILQKDAPWIFGYHFVRYGLYHAWYRNAYPHGFAYNTAKYLRIDAARRAAYRKKHAVPR